MYIYMYININVRIYIYDYLNMHLLNERRHARCKFPPQVFERESIARIYVNVTKPLSDWPLHDIAIPNIVWCLS